MASASANIKQEKLEEIGNALLAIPGLAEGIPVDLLCQKVKFSKEECNHGINYLLRLGKIGMEKGENTPLMCRLKQIQLPLEGLTAQERAVYEVIAEAGNQGIWIRDIRNKTNLMMPPLNKILKMLETTKKIKAVKSVMASKKKVYMLYDLEPDSKVTGDLFYSDQKEFDTVFTDLMFKCTLQFLEQRVQISRSQSQGLGPLAFRDRSYATAKQILSHIQGLGLFKVKIEERDMLKVLRSLKMAGKIESSTVVDPSLPEGSVDCFRILPPLIGLPAIARTPCGTCPLLLHCGTSGAISPVTCTYLQEWMDMDMPNAEPT